MIRKTSTAFLSLAFFVSMGFAVHTAAAEVPTPEEVIGHKVGADYKLADWNMILKYFRNLDEASDRVALERIGMSTMGKDMILVVISNRENLARVQEIKSAMARLADPRGLTERDAGNLIDRMPAVLLVGCAQHATEIASTQTALESAYRLAVEESPFMDQIRKNTVFLLIPSLNPDGHQMVCDWYKEHVGTPFEGSRMPWLYHKYVGHDTNRDWAMITQVETLNCSRVFYEEWFPQIIIDMHQMGNRGARMFIPPYHDPVNPNMDPMIQHLISLLSAKMQVDLSAAGHKGVINYAMFDEWLLGFLTSVPTRHNMVAQLIEMASVNIASPIFQRQRDLGTSRGSGTYSRRANFPEPWEGGWWRLRDIVDYELTATFSALELTAKNRVEFLTTFYRLGKTQIEAGKSEPPFAYLVPPGQEDPATSFEMLATLMRGGVEVHRARAAFQADGISYPAGTYVVLMAQPYRAHAKDMLEKQVYPDLRAYPGGPPERPYDVAGWTVSLMMGVKAVEVVNPFEADLSELPGIGVWPEGTITPTTGGLRYLLIDRKQNNAFTLVNGLLAEGAHVRAFAGETVVGDRKYPPGTFVLGTGSAVSETLQNRVKGLGLRAMGCGSLPEKVEYLELKPVRLGLYQPWTASMDEGWTRWVFEKYEFAYTSVHDAEIRAGGLRDRYDAIVIPDIRSESIIRGVSEGSLPKKYCGGIGEEGVFALRDFVREGGTLIGIDSSCDFLIQTLEIPVTNIVRRESRGAGYTRRESASSEDSNRFFCPGSILQLDMDPAHPLAFGMKPASAIMHSSSPVFEVGKKPGGEKKGDSGDRDREGDDRDAPAKVKVVGSYPKLNPLMSGWIDNDHLIHGKAALVEAGFGKGKAVLIGFRCQFRAQSHGTFKILFNAILAATQK
jgi:hypothetical protein